MSAQPNQQKRTRKKVVRWLKRITVAVFLTAVAALVIMAWMPKPTPVETAVVTTGELVVTVSEDGRTRVIDRYVVSAPLAGNLARIDLHPGDEVKEGDVIARIVPLTSPLMDARTREQAEARVAASTAGTKQAKAQIKRAKAALELAHKEARRVEKLAKQGHVPQADLDRAQLDERTREAELASAQFGARVAKHELRMAKSTLKSAEKADAHEEIEQLEVTSPIDGRVLQVLQESEGVTMAGAALLELGDPKALEIVVDVLTRDAVQIEHGAPASIDRWGGDPIRAAVRLVEPSAFTRLSSLGVEEQRVNAILDLEDPYETWRSLGDGYRVEAKITIWRAAGVTKVPSSALFRHDEGWAVFVVEDDTATLRPVEIGRRNGLEAEVRSGLQDGDRVVLHPSDAVTDGIAVVWR